MSGIRDFIVRKKFVVFETIKHELKHDKKFEVRAKLDILHNPDMKNLFNFILPVITILERANRLFHSDKVDPLNAFREIETLSKTIKSRTFDFRGNKKPFDQIYFGIDFEIFNVSLDCMHWCNNFLIRLDKELAERCKSSKRHLEKLVLLQAKDIFNEKIKPTFSSFPKNSLSTSIAEEEYRRIGLIKWKDVFNQEPMQMSTDEFWASARNRLMIARLDSILRVTEELGSGCWRNYKIDTRMLEIFSNDMYN